MGPDNKILRMDRDGTNVEEIITGGLGNVNGLAIGTIVE